MAQADAIDGSLGSRALTEKAVDCGIHETAHTERGEAPLGCEQTEVLGCMAGLEEHVTIAARTVLVERPVEDGGHEDDGTGVLEEEWSEECVGELGAIDRGKYGLENVIQDAVVIEPILESFDPLQQHIELERIEGPGGRYRPPLQLEALTEGDRPRRSVGAREDLREVRERERCRREGSARSASPNHADQGASIVDVGQGDALSAVSDLAVSLEPFVMGLRVERGLGVEVVEQRQRARVGGVEHEFLLQASG
jgi:hypothetical protein